MRAKFVRRNYAVGLAVLLVCFAAHGFAQFQAPTQDELKMTAQKGN